MKIAYQDLSRWDKQELNEIEAAISRVLRKGRFILGEELSAFEEEFSGYLGRKFAIGVGSGTDAITLALIASGIKPGDEVITSSLTAYPTITGIERAGAVPVVIDVRKETGLLDPDKISAAVSDKTKAIIPVHLWGNACEMDKIHEIALNSGLIIIEDCAQAVGTELQGHYAGYWSSCAAYSFYPTKNLGAIGDGGAIVTDDFVIYQKLKQLRNYGQKERDLNEIPGFNSRLDEIQAAILRIRLKYLPAKIKKRRETAQKYLLRLKSEILPEIADNSKPGYHIFPIIIENRNELKDFFYRNQIDVLVHYPVPVFRQPGFSGRISGACGNAEYIAQRELSLPVSEWLQEAEKHKIINLLEGWQK